MAEENLKELSREENEKVSERNLLLDECDEQIADASEEEASGTPEVKESAPSAPPKRRFRDYLGIVRTVCASLIVAAAVVVLIVYFIFPVMRIYGSSMSSTLVDGDIVISFKTTHLERGDICAFYSSSRILCKRVIGLAGDVIDIDAKGTVFVNGEEIDEPYLKGKSLGDGDVEFPMTVPENSYFVLGDNRRASVDSRNTIIGCVPEEQVVGKIVFCVLPFPSFGVIE